MNPWWLRPPAEEGSAKAEESSAKEKKPKQAAEKAPRQQQAKTEEKSGTEQRRSGSHRGKSRRRSSGSKGGDTKKVSHDRMALLCDIENVALALRSSDVKGFDLRLILDRLGEIGKLVAMRAYGDWQRHSEFKGGFREAGFELIDIPPKFHSGRNSADIKLAVDAMELCYAKGSIDTFVILSGEGDFSPLVAKLQEAKKRVIGMGVKGSVSAALEEGCDEYLFYDDLAQETWAVPEMEGMEESKAPIFTQLVETIRSLEQEGKGVIWGSQLKQEMRRRLPDFNEGSHGYSTFTELLEDAERHEVIHLERDDRSGSYYVAGFGRQ